MSGRRMLRDIMAASDVYQYADLIMEMLREDYGSYDGDALDEVLVEETFVQRLASRGYEVRPWVDVSPAESAPAAAPAPTPLPSSDVVPVTIVRQRRTPGSAERPTERATGTPQTRTRRSAASTETPQPAANGDSAPPPRPKAEGTRSSGTGTTAPRTRRTTRTPRSNGDGEA